MSPSVSLIGDQSLPRSAIFEALASHDPASVAVVHAISGRSFTYGELLNDVIRAKELFLDARGNAGLAGERIAILVQNSYDYVVTLLACLAVEAIAVPLLPSFPLPELQYVLNQSEASMLVASPKFFDKAQEVLKNDVNLDVSCILLSKHEGTKKTTKLPIEWIEPLSDSAGLMLYTSGTTSRPKGVLLPLSVLVAQCQSLQTAWEYSPSDHLLHVLPLHHIHGTINAVLTPLIAGSTVEFLYPFNADAMWRRLASPFLPVESQSPSSANSTATANTQNNSTPKTPINFLTAVPTVYSRLLDSYKNLPTDVQAAARTAISPSHMRLSISGSAALPTPVKAAWEELSRGNVLLERYGMTEVGMALSCGLAISDRIDASVGWPLPSVEVRLVDTETGQVVKPGEDVDSTTGREIPGEIQLRGPTIFKEYWRNPAATASEFVDGADGKGKWFKTGDVAVRRHVASAGLNQSQPWARGPMYFIQGRKSADIIKTGGEKVSALEVERELLSLPQVSEAAVVAVPSGRWGQKIGAVVVLDTNVTTKWSPMDMRRALKVRMANYKIPQLLKVVDDIPRNAMGKINKKVLVQTLFADEHSDVEV